MKCTLSKLQSTIQALRLGYQLVVTINSWPAQPEQHPKIPALCLPCSVRLGCLVGLRLARFCCLLCNEAE